MDWSEGRYEAIAEHLLPAATVVVDIADPTRGETVVDVGCGTGNAALLAAKRGARVIGIDPAERLLEVAAAAATKRDLDAEFVVGEAASMPVETAEADLVISAFGVIFAPDPAAAAAEMTRVLRPGGRIVLAAWVPEGAISRAVRITREAMTEALGEPAPAPRFGWHEQEALSGLFAPHGLKVATSEHRISFTADSAGEFVTREERNHPLAVAAQNVVERAGRGEELRRRLLELYEKSNEDPEGFRVTSSYVVAVIDGSP
jgi:SAM-dependent methyltransferase